ncbi:MAG TPA: CRISPR-associated helicase Cas3' [Methylococcus sp.]|nr:CRISPR-associated helicase Cas3' [Methylococcus sp.]
MNSHFWGKLSSCGRIHPLVDHALDVAWVFHSLAARFRARLSATTATHLSEAHLHRLSAVAFLHDLGKCNRGFQAKRDPNAKETAGHVFEAVAFLLDEGIHKRWPKAWTELIEEMSAWFADEDELWTMLIAAISHHGRPVSERDYRAWGDRNPARWWQPQNGLDPMQGIEELAHTIRAVFPEAFAADIPPITATPAFQQRFAGMVMLADWIGSDTQFFPYRQSEAEDRLVFAKEAAQHALRAIGLMPPESRRPHTFQDVFGFGPNPLQLALAQDLSSDDACRLVLVESDTGSGKTEAALAWFFRLYAEGMVEGLYFALPTRVAARELYGRVLRAIEHAFDDDARPQPVLLAVPGYVRVDGEPVLPDPEGRLWDDDTKARQRERIWAAERPKRFLAAPIAVGTIDQALLSVLQVKHALLRSVCLDRHLLVVDEVHASDPYMREELCTLLRGHLARGGWALLLSATLGEAARSEFFESQTLPLAQAIERPYPSLTTRSREHPVAARGASRRIEVALFPTLADDASLLPELKTALAAGARVLVVCNTVARANALLRAVEQNDAISKDALFAVNGIICPHHGRFARADREVLDAAVSARLGKDTPAGPVLVVGTQTLEQSLDIDADWLITDLCPMDVLLQRLGRLHRHPRSTRPEGYTTPRVLVRIPEGELASFVGKGGQLHGPAGLGPVYADGRVLQRTLDVLRERSILTIPEDNRFLVEYTTHPDALSTLGEAWKPHVQWIEGSVLSEIRQAMASTLKDAPFWDLHYPDKSERVLTRLGEQGWDLPLATPVASPFGAIVDRIVIPAQWLPDGLNPPECIEAGYTAKGFAFALGAHRFRYTRFGLEKEDD